MKYGRFYLEICVPFMEGRNDERMGGRDEGNIANHLVDCLMERIPEFHPFFVFSQSFRFNTDAYRYGNGEGHAKVIRIWKRGDDSAWERDVNGPY